MAKTPSSKRESPHQYIEISYSGKNTKPARITMILTPNEKATKDDYIKERNALRSYLLRALYELPFSPHRIASKKYKLIINVPEGKAFDYGEEIFKAIAQLWTLHSQDAQTPLQPVAASVESESPFLETSTPLNPARFQSRIHRNSSNAKNDDSLQEEMRKILEAPDTVDDKIYALTQLFSEQNRTRLSPGRN